MLSIVLIAAALLIAGLVLQLRSRDSAERATSARAAACTALMTGATPAPSVSSAKPVRPTVAVVLRVQKPDCACENARKFADKIFVLGDAPQLPFKGCMREDCGCRYQPITNRRTKGEQRKNASRREQIRFDMKDDRRQGKDRRQLNNVWKTPV
jgi:hypothetical protein